MAGFCIVSFPGMLRSSRIPLPGAQAICEEIPGSLLGRIFGKSPVEALWKPYIDTYSLQICVILSSILAAMDELVKSAGQMDGTYLMLEDLADGL
jgi:hypothetical protein